MSVPVLRPAPRDQASDPFASDVIAGLSATPKRLLPKYFYDEIGSLSAGPIVSKNRVPASMIFFAAAVLFLRGGAAANHGWLPTTLEKHKRYLNSEIERLEPQPAAQVPTMPASSDEVGSQALPEPRK